MIIRNLNIALSLLISLFIYLFYRTESILITRLISYLFEGVGFLGIQNFVVEQLPLSSWIIYSLPEGLWIFATTLASRTFFLEIKNTKINLAVFPLTIAFLIEVFQYFNISNGTYDLLDLLFATFFSCLGYLLFKPSSLVQTKFHPFKLNDFLCLASYLIVFLAHSSV